MALLLSRRILYGGIAALLAASAAAQEEAATPLIGEGEEVVLFAVRENPLWLASSARRALSLGFYGLALDIVGQVKEIEAAGDDSGLQRELRYIAIDANLALERFDAASLLLSGALDGPASALRRALLAFGQGESLEAPLEALVEVSADSLSPGEGAWLLALRAWQLSQAGERERSAAFFGAALEKARQVSPAQTAQIAYLSFRRRLAAADEPSPELEQELRKAMTDNAGAEIAFRYGQQLAAYLVGSDRRDEAIALLAQQLDTLPEAYAGLRQELLLQQFLAAGQARSEGRLAIRSLLGDGEAPQLMSIALQELVSSSLNAEGAQATAFLENVLGELIQMDPEHVLLSEALYYRSALRHRQADHEGAEDDALALQQRFPNSHYRKGALAIMASSAWERQRFRTAASYLSQLRVDFAEPQQATQLAALIADCYYQAGLQSSSEEDFSYAADAYAIAFAEMVADEDISRSFFQLVASLLKAGEVGEAVRAVDDAVDKRGISTSIRWQAEWMLARAMREQGNLLSEAYERIQQRVDAAQDELKLRFLWLAAKLSLESGQPDETEFWLESLENFKREESGDKIDAALLAEVMSSALLTLAESTFAIGEPEAAVGILERIREEYPALEAAIYSYFIQARYLSSLDQTVEAQRLLVYLADNFPESRLAPMALYEAAINAERRGQEAFLDQAKQLLERIAQDYPNSEMVFYARLKQGDLLRKLNKFGAAQQLYELLENQYRSRPDRYLAQISLADTLMARASEDESKFEAAISRLELLLDLPEIPMDLRVEAGYKLGVAWQNQGEARKARQAFWTLHDLILVDENRIHTLGSKGRYWLARSLFALAEIAEREDELDQSRAYYETIVSLRAPGFELAQEQLERMVAPSAN